MSKPKPTNEALKFAEIYEQAVKEGEARFGSECDHKGARNGVCPKCMRRIVS